MHVLLVEPSYYTQYPPISLLKIATLEKEKGNSVELVRGISKVNKKPRRVYVTSLFTYAWQPVHDAIKYYRKQFPQAKIKLGGIYASLLAKHAKKTGAGIHCGVIPEAEIVKPDYSLLKTSTKWANWDGSIIFASRGCIRRCPFCGVWLHEPKFESRKSIRSLIYPRYRRITLWDNNILASHYIEYILNELAESGKEVDFNQGLDARLITEEIAYKLSKIKMKFIRLAYDQTVNKNAVDKAIGLLKEMGFDGRRIVVYVLFNFQDTPEDFLERIRDLISWGVVTYPMRYEPINSLEKNSYIAPGWTAEELEMVTKARRVLGYAGAWPPTDGLKWKFINNWNFRRVFSLRPIRSSKKIYVRL